jgi:hypothetical protein
MINTVALRSVWDPGPKSESGPVLQIRIRQHCMSIFRRCREYTPSSVQQMIVHNLDHCDLPKEKYSTRNVSFFSHYSI